MLHEGLPSEIDARGFARDLGLGLQAAALNRSSSAPVFDGFCSQRPNPRRRGFLYGDLGGAINEVSLLERTLALIDGFPD